MCGIFGYIGHNNNAAKIVLAGLKTLEYRGYDSWGVAVVKDDPTSPRRISGLRGVTAKCIAVKKRIGKIGEATVEELPESSLGFGHTRWATHGGVTQVNAHPHLDCTKTIAVVHNGIVENFEELKKELLGKHHTFVSQTDSEVIAHLIEKFGKAHAFDESVRKAFALLEGCNATVAIHSDERMIVAIRNGSPLVVGLGDGEYFVASDASALLPHTKRVYFMEDYDMAVLTDRGIAIADARTGKKKSVSFQRLTWTKDQAEKGSYESFMLKEIHEQPEVLSKIIHRKDKDALRHLADAIHASYGAYLIGCGTASYACLAGTYLFSTIAKRHINVAIASEFSYHEDFLTKKSLVIALSQSGETMDLITAVKLARGKGATIASLVNVMGSTLYRLSDIPILTLAGPEIGVASTKDMIAKLAHLVLLAYGVSGKTTEGIRSLGQAKRASEGVLSPSSVRNIKKLAVLIQKAQHMFVVGRGLSYPASLETALKIKEISYIHAEGLAAGELKHGPLALVERGTPCMVFLPNDETYGANLAGAMEMKARGGFVIGVSHKPHEVFDYYIPVPDAGVATIIPNIIVGQLLAYYLATGKGLDPDKPRNLAKSVTVK